MKKKFEILLLKLALWILSRHQQRLSVMTIRDSHVLIGRYFELKAMVKRVENSYPSISEIDYAKISMTIDEFNRYLEYKNVSKQIVDLWEEPEIYFKTPIAYGLPVIKLKHLNELSRK